MDERLRLLERAASRGDPADVKALAVARCRLGQHDYRCDRLCAACQRQAPGLTFHQAMISGNGRGAVGWAKGHVLARAYGTEKGFPRLSRSQEGLKITFSRPQRLFWKEWEPPIGQIPWAKVNKRASVRTNTAYGGPGVRGTYRKLLQTPMELMKMLTWEPTCDICHGQGYRGRLSSTLDHFDVVDPCEGCGSMPLTDALLAGNARAQREQDEYDEAVARTTAAHRAYVARVAEEIPVADLPEGDPEDYGDGVGL